MCSPPVTLLQISERNRISFIFQFPINIAIQSGVGAGRWRRPRGSLVLLLEEEVVLLLDVDGHLLHREAGTPILKSKRVMFSLGLRILQQLASWSTMPIMSLMRLGTGSRDSLKRMLFLTEMRVDRTSCFTVLLNSLKKLLLADDSFRNSSARSDRCRQTALSVLTLRDLAEGVCRQRTKRLLLSYFCRNSRTSCLRWAPFCSRKGTISSRLFSGDSTFLRNLAFSIRSTSPSWLLQTHVSWCAPVRSQASQHPSTSPSPIVFSDTFLFVLLARSCTSWLLLAASFPQATRLQSLNSPRKMTQTQRAGSSSLQRTLLQARRCSSMRQISDSRAYRQSSLKSGTEESSSNFCLLQDLTCALDSVPQCCFFTSSNWHASFATAFVPRRWLSPRSPKLSRRPTTCTIRSSNSAFFAEGACTCIAPPVQRLSWRVSRLGFGVSYQGWGCRGLKEWFLARAGTAVGQKADSFKLLVLPGAFCSRLSTSSSRTSFSGYVRWTSPVRMMQKLSARSCTRQMYSPGVAQRTSIQLLTSRSALQFLAKVSKQGSSLRRSAIALHSFSVLAKGGRARRAVSVQFLMIEETPFKQVCSCWSSYSQLLESIASSCTHDCSSMFKQYKLTLPHKITELVATHSIFKWKVQLEENC